MIDSLLMIVVLWRLWCNTSWRLMVLVSSTPLYHACKWAINKDQIICLWRLVSSTVVFNYLHWTWICYIVCLSIWMVSECYIQLQYYHKCLWLWNMKFQVCKIVEGQRYSKRLNEKQITALLKVTCQRPQERELDILQVAVYHMFYQCLHLMISNV